MSVFQNLLWCIIDTFTSVNKHNKVNKCLRWILKLLWWQNECSTYYVYWGCLLAPWSGGPCSTRPVFQAVRNAEFHPHLVIFSTIFVFLNFVYYLITWKLSFPSKNTKSITSFFSLFLSSSIFLSANFIVLYISPFITELTFVSNPIPAQILQRFGDFCPCSLPIFPTKLQHKNKHNFLWNILWLTS